MKSFITLLAILMTVSIVSAQEDKNELARLQLIRSMIEKDVISPYEAESLMEKSGKEQAKELESLIASKKEQLKKDFEEKAISLAARGGISEEEAMKKILVSKGHKEELVEKSFGKKEEKTSISARELAKLREYLSQIEPKCGLNNRTFSRLEKDLRGRLGITAKILESQKELIKSEAPEYAKKIQ